MLYSTKKIGHNIKNTMYNITNRIMPALFSVLFPGDKVMATIMRPTKYSTRLVEINGMIQLVKNPPTKLPNEIKT